jgi:uncharacterized protein (DUF302 family)
MTNICRYGFGTESALGFDLLTEKLEEILNRRGFNITTRLRMDDVLNETLPGSFGRYVILGACNPDYARALFNADPNVGLMMPCNVIVYELQEGGCKVMVKDPALLMDLINNPIAIEASIKVKQQMEEVIAEVLKLEKQSLASRLNPFSN